MQTLGEIWPKCHLKLWQAICGIICGNAAGGGMVFMCEVASNKLNFVYVIYETNSKTNEIS